MTKKILSLALVLMMMFTLAVPAFAADEVPDEVYSSALAAAAVRFENNDVSQTLIDAAKVTSVEYTESVLTVDYYEVTVTAGLIYTYTCTVSYANLTGVALAYSAEYAENTNAAMVFLNSIYEFFLDIVASIANLFTV